MAKILRH